jgi:ZIP family zinc transporter
MDEPFRGGILMRSTLPWLAVPAGALVLVVTLLLIWRPLDQLSTSAPPVEEIAVESVVLSAGLIQLSLRTDGSEPISIAQVQVDGAYRTFTADPAVPQSRFDTVQLDIPYPWVTGEAHRIALITTTGLVVEHEIEVAQETPRLDASSIRLLGTVGILLGVVPVIIGLLAWPAMRSISPVGLNFILALTIGLLGFLFVDTIGEGLEHAGMSIGRLRGPVLFWAILGATAIVLLAIGRKQGHPPEGLKLAGFIALGIGLHNFGEGLAVGAALASGAASLASYLVIGFTIHNVTEGIGIAAPISKDKPTFGHFAGLAALAGLPAVAGTILGTQAVSPLWIAICFGIGAGAILQVILEVASMMLRGSNSLLSPSTAAGVTVGLAVMYATALLV